MGPYIGVPAIECWRENENSSQNWKCDDELGSGLMPRPFLVEGSSPNAKIRIDTLKTFKMFPTWDRCSPGCLIPFHNLPSSKNQR